MSYTKKQITVGVVAASLAFSASLMWSAAADPADSPDVQQVEPSGFPTNAHGLTYGSDAGVSNPADLPDLIQVVGDNGRRGYTLKKDADRADESQANSTVPVFGPDGKTQIDTFTLSDATEIDVTREQYERLRNGEPLNEVLELPR